MTEVISVRFRGGCKNYFFDPGGTEVKLGDQVIVETAQGPEFAICTEANHDVDDALIVKPLCALLRMATDADRETADRNRKRENEAFDICEKKIADHALEMKLVSVSCSFDGSKIIFFFTADGRVDFRELVRDLAGVFRSRIELRQIGVRDEAKMIGGLGICGRPFCCSQFLDGFLPVSIKMAKTQNLSLNPTKISGTCGRLMCCLKYEQNAYEDAARRMPKAESFVMTPDGSGNVKSVDLLREKVKVSLDGAAPADGLKCYHNCEVCVLRNGKGSRDGIELPAERPARFVPEKKEEPDPLAPPISSFFDLDAAEAAPQSVPQSASVPGEEDAASAGEKSRRRRRSRGRRGAKREGEPARSEERQEPGESRPEPREPRPERQQEKRPPRPERGDKPRKPFGGTPDGGNRRRGPADGVSARRPPQPAGENGDVKRPAAGAESEGDAKRRRPHHRGGRRHRSGGESAAPKDE